MGVNIWDEYGFTASPYTTDPVPPTELGERLFVGRSDELRRVGMLIASAATHPTIEGDNGRKNKSRRGGELPCAARL